MANLLLLIKLYSHPQAMFRLLGHNIRDEHFSTEREIAVAAHNAFTRGRVIGMKSTPPIAGTAYTVGNFTK